METVFVLIEEHYADGMMAWVFHNEGDAILEMEARKRQLETEWREQGYTPVVYSRYVTVVEQRDDIFAEFWIDETEMI